uniref:MBOAT family protein n=1 Tax=Strongyloides papillosus TaxID=174720 RepID=A0A0N5CC54_STREA
MILGIQEVFFDLVIFLSSFSSVVLFLHFLAKKLIPTSVSFLIVVCFIFSTFTNSKVSFFISVYFFVAFLAITVGKDFSPVYFFHFVLSGISSP